MSADPNPPKPPVAGLALKDHDALPAGTRFGEFEIIRVLGVGGFGIVYLAQDHSLERQVALKEYMPAALAARGAGPMITIRAASFAETFAIGLRSFINEARLLARFDHPSLVKVYRFWEDNGTAYMVMPYLQGRTLRDARRAMAQAPDEAWIRGVLDPLLDALELLHSEGVFHRDIAPDNILLLAGALPILLDFGAARRVIADRTQSLTAIVKPSYAPIEQYAEMAALRQGPWTDLYALGAVLHYLLFGVPPAPATARAVQPEIDRSEPFAQRMVPGVSPRFMGIVAWMLGVRPIDRPQNVMSVRAALNGEIPISADADHAVTVPMVAAPPAAVSATQAIALPHETVQAAPPAAARAQPSTPAVHPSATPPTGSAPMRSTPPGTLPPAYVPAARMASVLPTPPAAAVEPEPVAGAVPRRGLMLAGGLAAAAIAVGVMWQFVDVISGPRRVAPALAA
ncbi:MAG: serine/threonine-protein kinase, partial [Burkholderiales bacterium]